MKKYEVNVNNNLFRLQYEPKSSSAKINDVIQYINQQKGFPAQAKYDISIDNHIRDKNFDLKDANTHIIYIKISDEIETFTIQHINKDERQKIVLQKVDTCQQLIEIEKRIANTIQCEEYPIKILKQNQILDRNLLLCQIFIYQQEINYLVLAMFIIKYKDKLELFQIDAFLHFDKIKQKIRQKFGIEEEIDLYFRGELLEEQKTYYSYKIHQNAELELKIKNIQKIKIVYEDNIYEYNVSINLTIEDLIKYYKQSIHQNQILQIHYNNQLLENSIKIGSLDLQSNHILTMTNKILEKYLIVQFLNKGQEQKNYLLRVSNLDYFQIIYEKQPFFKGKVFEFYVNDNKLEINDQLIFNDIEFKDNKYLIQYQMIQNYKNINVTFLDEKGKTLKIQVKSDDIINNEIKKNFNHDNIKIEAYKKGQLIDLNGTYKSQDIQDGDIIYYCFGEMQKIQFMIWLKNQHEIQEIKMHYLDRVKDLKENLIQEYKITDCKVLFEGKFLNDNDFIKNYNKKEVFIIRQQFDFKIELILDNITEEFESKFYECDNMSLIKSKYSDMFSDDVCIQIENKKDLDDNEDLSEYINKVLIISKRNINVRYKFYGTEDIYKKKYYKNITLGEMLKMIDNRTSRCYIGNNLMDQDSKLIDLNLDPSTEMIIQCTFKAQFIEFNNNLNKFDIEFYPEDIIGQAIQNHIKGKFKIQLGNRELNIQNSFENEKITNNAEVFYMLLVTIQFKDFETKELLFQQTCNINMKIIKILNQKHFKKTRVYYQDKEINQDKTLAEVGVVDYSELHIEELENTLILHFDNDIRDIIINQNMTIQQLKQQENLNHQNYQLYSIYDQKQPLQNDIILKSLLNENNEIELIYKMNNNCIQINLTDIEDRQYTENIQLNQQVKTFIKEFKNKHNFGDISICYNGEILNQEDYFSQLQITQDANFEIII